MIKRFFWLIILFFYFTDCFDKIVIETEENGLEEVKIIMLSTIVIVKSGIFMKLNYNDIEHSILLDFQRFIFILWNKITLCFRVVTSYDGL